jgi:hypothetical protein
MKSIIIVEVIVAMLFALGVGLAWFRWFYNDDS